MEEEQEAWQQLVTKVNAPIIHSLLHYIKLNKRLDKDEININA